MTATRLGTRWALACSAAALAIVGGLAAAAPAPASPVEGTTPQAALTSATPKAGTKAGARSAAADFTSIFASQQPSLSDAGWAACAAPVSWSVDVRGLGAAEAKDQIANITAAFDQWAQVTGLAFTFAGIASFRYDETAFTLTAADGTPATTRTINLAFIADEASALLGGQTVGLAGPTTVWASSKKIESGTGVFRIDAVKDMTNAEARALFTHELGHVLGLGHASDEANVMYPVVSAQASLGAGDIAGVRSLLKTCA